MDAYVIMDVIMVVIMVVIMDVIMVYNGVMMETRFADEAQTREGIA